MTSNEILHADLLDILFENRNKEYGAYALRKNYDKRMGTAMMILFMSIIIFSFFTLAGSNRNTKSLSVAFLPDTITILTMPVAPLPPKEPEPQPGPPAKTLASVKSTSIIQILKDSRTLTDIPDQENLSDKLISNVTMPGSLLPGDIINNVPGATDGKGAAPAEPMEEASPEFIKSEVEAQFPGGLMAFSRFLSKNLRVPDDLPPGIKKTVLARFKVDINGKISEVVIMNSAGEKYDNEVIRVLYKMPHWKPAMQNGHKIPIYFMQPVSFLSNE